VVNGKTSHQARLDQDYGMAFQQSGLFDWRTVERNIELPLELKGWDKARRRARSAEMLALVKLSEFAGHMPWQLSGGMQQRVAIARALAAHPGLLLMDEPFGALDAQTREVMHDLILHIHKVEKTTIVFVTHDVEEAIYLGQRVVLMQPRPGRIHTIYPVPLPAEREQDMKHAPHFRALRAEILARIRESAGVATDQGALGKLNAPTGLE
jgi:NitT/TauT family transport system ATP-binding protein